MADDFYALLEVPRDASQDEIKTAFREKVQEYHPDHNDDPRANAQFTAVKKAYDTLGDPVERNAYDRMGHLDYVAKRLSGLPDPEKWAPETDEDASAGSSSGSATSSTDRSSTSTGTASTGASTGSGRSTGSASSGRSSSSGRSGSASTSSSTSTGRGSSSSAGSSTSSSGTSTGSVSTGTPHPSGQRTASDGAGAAASSRSVAYSDDPIVDFVARHDWARTLVGWPLLYFVMALYAAGVGAVVAEYSGAFGDLADRTSAAGTDTAALSDAFERESVPIVYEATIGEIVAGASPGTTVLAGGALIALGAVLLPTVVFLLVYLTRLSPGWKPTYLYPVAVLGPVAGLAAGAAMEVPLVAELVLFGVLPFGAFAVMLLSAFIRPKVKAVLFG